jgi:histidine triad (HIT) family protein
MATLFTQIIEGTIHGRFVWKDDLAVVFLTIEPIAPGHVLVVPRQEIDHWIDAEPKLQHHLMDVANSIGQALMLAFGAQRVGLMIAGLEVPHLHVHVLPISSEHDLAFANANRNATNKELDRAQEAIKASLRDLGLNQP